jgi:hypothetical protein
LVRQGIFLFAANLIRSQEVPKEKNMHAQRLVLGVIILLAVSSLIGVNPLVAQDPCPPQININCTTCGLGLCWDCGWNDALSIYPDAAVYCGWEGWDCYYCWNGCSYPQDMCQTVRITGVHRCNESYPYYPISGYWCCNYCGY